MGSAAVSRRLSYSYPLVTISVGSRLGPYEIVAPLGAGGMGEVWRARDTRLERSVAIKVLPAEFAEPEIAAEKDGPARFAQFQKGGIGGVLDIVPRKAPQNRVGLGGAEP